MLTLATGSGIGKIFGLVTMPVITRIYSPEDIGVLSVFVAMASILGAFGTLRYSVAIPLPKTDGLALNIITVCFMFLLLNTSITAVMLWFAKTPLLSLLSMQVLEPFWWLLPVVLFGMGLYEILNGWATREKEFKIISKTQIWQALLNAGSKIVLGLYGFKPIGLLIGHTISQIGGFLILTKLVLKKFNRKHIRTYRLLFVIKRYRDLPTYRLLSQFLLIFSVQAPLLFSSLLYGKEVVGQIGFALNMLAVPFVLLGNTTGQAFYAEISKIGRKQPKKIFRLTKKVVSKLLIFSLPPFLLLAFFGPLLFKVVFGEKWEVSGEYSQVFAIYLLMQFVSSPIVNILNVFGRQGLFLYINVIRVCIVLIVFFLAYSYQLNEKIAMLFYSVFLSGHYLLTLCVVMILVKKEVKNAVAR